MRIGLKMSAGLELAREPEIESVEAVLEKAGKQPLEQGELSELRRILYGKEAK